MESIAHKRILVVDDEPAFVQLLSSILHANYEIYVARSGEEALAVCGQFPPDLILLDVNMPVMDGLTACRLLKSLPSTSDIPVIFLTSQENTDDEIVALEAGGDDFISKPVNAHILKARIKTHLRIKSQQQALRQSEERLRLALQSARMGVWEVDLISKKIFWSQEIFRYFFKGDVEPTEEEFFGSLVHPEDVEGLKEAIGRSIAERSTFVAEFRVGGLGNYQWVEDRGHVVLDAENNPIKMVGTVAGISDRKQTELELSSSKQRLELALEASGLGLWEFDFLSDLFEMNDRWFAMLGYQRKDMQWNYAAWETLIHPSDLPAMKEALVRHFQGSTPRFESEHRARHKEGHWVWIQARGKVVQRDQDGHPLRMIGTHFDMSHRKHMVLEGTDLLKKIEALLQSVNDSSGRTSSAQESITQANREQFRLTRRQEEVLKLIVSGKTSTQIAQLLKISRGTAISHRKDLMRKLNVHNVAELTSCAIQHHMLKI